MPPRVSPWIFVFLDEHLPPSLLDLVEIETIGVILLCPNDKISRFLAIFSIFKGISGTYRQKRAIMLQVEVHVPLLDLVG